MKADEIVAELRASLNDPLPLPGRGETAKRHKRLQELGRKNLSLARLAEAHWDAVAILAEDDRLPEPGCIYGVWASEIPGQMLRLTEGPEGLSLNGKKMFCSGAGLIDRALVTAGLPESRLIDIDLRSETDRVHFDMSDWKAEAFRETQTASTTFVSMPVLEGNLIGGRDFYLGRSGFWHGACGPAACWAGGAAGLVDFAGRQRRNDPHTLAHLGALYSLEWALTSYLEVAGNEIDSTFADTSLALKRALKLRHLVEQACTEIIRRFARAYGPHPIAMDKEISRRYAELDLYLRQSHGERDLHTLGQRFALEG